jgi:hypothetical protein
LDSTVRPTIPLVRDSKAKSHTRCDETASPRLILAGVFVASVTSSTKIIAIAADGARATAASPGNDNARFIDMLSALVNNATSDVIQLSKQAARV